MSDDKDDVGICRSCSEVVEACVCRFPPALRAALDVPFQVGPDRELWASYDDERRDRARAMAAALRWATYYTNRDIDGPILDAIAALEQEASK